MPGINEKALLRRFAGFLNLRTVFKLIANLRSRRDRPFFIFEGRTYTYGETWTESLRYARLFAAVKQEKAAAGRLASAGPLAVGMYLDNCPEFVFALFGAAISASTLIAVNTGFRGDTLARVLNEAEISLLVTSSAHLEEIGRALPQLTGITDRDVLVVNQKPEDIGRGIESALADPACAAAVLPKKIDLFTTLIVIYTSGTTGAPKGVPCTQVKLVAAGVLTSYRLKLGKADRGYVCMPMFHSNAWYLGIMPILIGGGSFVLKPRFSASAFEEDVLAHGVTFLNYVGQPIHYILAALEKKYGSPEAVEAALARHPRNRFRTATGNGATPLDRQKMVRYLGMDHIYELYGTTEAPINAYLKPGDPPDSVGQVTSNKVVILNEHGEPCPPAEVDGQGRIVNYEAAVGEIAKITEQDNIFFDGYFKNPEATSKKFRDGFFRSGDLGYIRVVKGKRFLYFVGRTDDWIRKDGENFSAESVTAHLVEMPGVGLAAAFGAPCAVADETVMAAITLEKDAVFDPRAAFAWFLERQRSRGMDPKWMPDYIRLVEGFEMTHQTEKIVIRPLKRAHFHLEKFPEMVVYFRRRGDEAYRRMTREDFAAIKASFQENGRGTCLEGGGA